MTRLEKSDAQLDAEAEARRRNLEPPRQEHGFDDPDAYDPPDFKPSGPPPLAAPSEGLAAVIELHRAMWRDDNRIDRLVSRQPPLTRYEKTDDPELIRYGANEEFVIEQGSRVGMPMSGNMIRRLSEFPGPQYPWISALFGLKQRCRRAHPQHRSIERPYWRGSLCWSLVSFVIVRGFSLDSAAAILRVDREVEQTLTNALHLIEESIDEQRARAEKRAREDEGRAVTCKCGHGWSRHGGPGVGFRCLDDCGCARYMAYTELELHHVPSEEHRLECPRCRRAA